MTSFRGLGKTFKAFSGVSLLAGEWTANVENWAPDVEELVVGPLEQKPNNLADDDKEEDRPGHIGGAGGQDDEDDVLQKKN